MSINNRYALLAAAVALLLGGCSATTPSSHKASQPPAAPTNTVDAQQPEMIYFQTEDSHKAKTLTITARGYGAPPKKYYPENNRRLMAMRAAKLDAYRSLAERIHGLRIWGGTTVGEMVLEQDQFKVLLDAYIVGAKVLSIMPQKDGNYEAIVEIKVDQDFLYQALAHRQDLLKVPPAFSALKEPHENLAEPLQQESRVTEHQGVESRSQANFYFSD